MHELIYTVGFHHGVQPIISHTKLFKDLTVFKLSGAASAIAYYLGWDIAVVKESRYHYGRTGSLQIFVIGDDYMTACKSSRKAPPKVSGYEYEWQLEKKDIDGLDWDIYIYTPTEDD
ncbi:hypothetical protein HLH17_14395 [Acinetobacter sp. ANC 5380]|uniref:Uncharacterized protein n=1 Tax=Acinetobacter terrae TaxID=2731247 RepID=A0A7Y2RHC4_9GAMM|nr:hypothetical protein [Acinetobacter terrae]NNH78811.1 hypothetical protein [Acinetobacter terrae]